MSRVDTNTDYTQLGSSFDDVFGPLEASWTPELRKFEDELDQHFSFQTRLLELRAELGLTQQQAGEIVGEHQTELSRMERGRLTPSVSRAARIIDRLVAYKGRLAERAASSVTGAVTAPVYAAHDVARYFLHRQEDDDPITNMKLQKLLYYANGVSLGLRSVPLFREQILAWEHGPVVYEVWSAYRDGNNPIPRPPDFDPDVIDPDTRELLDSVYERWGVYTASGLRRLTHRERPWQTTPQNDVISEQVIREFFAEHLAR